MFGSQVQDDVLELLVNAPSSVAALFGYLSRGATTRINVADLAAVLTEFEKRGWVRLCLLSGNGAFRPVTKEDLHRAIAEYSAWLDHVWSLALFHRLSTTLYRDAPGEFSRAS